MITENNEDRMVVYLSDRLLLIYNTTMRALLLIFFSFLLFVFFFFSFFSFFSFFMYTQAQNSNRENFTRINAIFMPLFVSSYIPTTSISILSSIYSLFYACLNYMYVSTEKHLVVLRAHFFFFFFFSYQQYVHIYILYSTIYCSRYRKEKRTKQKVNQ